MRLSAAIALVTVTGIATFGLATMADRHVVASPLYVRCDAPVPTSVEVDGRTFMVACPSVGTFRLRKSKITGAWIALPA